jgi:exodeoxyribonuclease III
MAHLIEWLKSEQPDVMALQETKILDDDFPCLELRAAGYESVCSGQKSYNGVAILSREPATEVACDIPGFDDPQKRVIAATIAGVRVISVYVPNGERVSSPKYQYKLAWMERLEAYFRDEIGRHPRVVALGDFNVAPEERDVHDPVFWKGRVMFSEPERAMFQRFLATGFADAFRLFEQKPGEFTWWDYGWGAFPKNRGLRIDHVLVSEALRATCRECRIDRALRAKERPSDHAPVVTTFGLA